MSAQPTRGIFGTLDALEIETRKSHAITMGDLVNVLGDRGHLFLILFLMIPFLQPVPLPGLSTVIALVVAAVAFSFGRGRPPWVPQRLRDRKLNEKQVLRMCALGRKLILRLRRFIRPRAPSLWKGRAARRTKATVIVLAALLLSLPLPIPASNFFPGAAIFLLALGALEEDGYVVIVGYALFVVALAYFTLIGLLPYLGLRVAGFA